MSARDDLWAVLHGESRAGLNAITSEAATDAVIAAGWAPAEATPDRQRKLAREASISTYQARAVLAALRDEASA